MSKCEKSSLPSAATAFVAATWLGMILGVSFLATPVKFQASSLDLPVALEVGHVTFALFSKVEWVLALALAVPLIIPGAAQTARLLAAVVVIALVLECFWLLPALDARVEMIISGQPIPQTWHHLLYALAEIVKAVSLLSLAIYSLFTLGWREVPSVQEAPQ